MAASRRPLPRPLRVALAALSSLALTASAIALVGVAPAAAAPAGTSAGTVAPVLSYTFDGDSGSTVVDSSGNGNNGTWVGTPAYVPGVSGQAASVSGGANYVKLPLVAGKTDASGSFSYEFWMFEKARTSYGTLVSNQDFVSCNNKGLTLYNQATQGRLEACWGLTPGGTKEYVHAISPVLTGAWHHVAVSVDRTANTATFYTDGIKTAAAPAGSISASTIFNSGLAFNIGGLSGSEKDSGDGYTNAAIDAFSFYNAAISADQVAADFAATNPAPATYTVAFAGNGSTGGATASQAFTVGASAALTRNGFRRTGYAFAGWATAPTGAVAYADGATVGNLTTTDGSTVTLYAVWNRVRADGDTVAPIISYNFDKDAVGAVVDSSGNGNDGTWTGTPEYGTGLGGVGRAIRVSDGANFVQLPFLAGKTDGSGSFSFVFWLGQESNTGDAWVFANIAGGSCNLAGLGLYDITPGVLQGCFGQTVGGTRQYQKLGSSSINSAWHQVAGVVDRSAQTVTWYLDGTAVATSAAGAMTASTNLNSGKPFTLGQNGLGNYAYGTNSWFDDVDFYNSAIGADQIRNDYNATKPASLTLPVSTGGGIRVGTTVPRGFVTDAFHAPQTRVGAHVSQAVGGLWNGGAVTSYRKVSGDDWLNVGADGVVTGTAPAVRPQDPATITVEATDGTTTSRLTVEIEVLGAGDGAQLAAATWNLWDAGTHVDDAPWKDLAVIANNGLDVVGVQEDGGVVAQQIARALGWYAYEGPGGVGVISAYPIAADGAATPGDAPAAGVSVDVLGAPVRVWTAGLDGAGYGPHNACLSGTTDPSALVSAEKSTVRFAQASALATAMSGDVRAAGTTPVVLLADLESPAVSDSTSATSAAHCGVGAVDWPVPDAIAAAGLKDTYRVANPDPTAAPGTTWSPVVKTDAASGRAEPQDRIDAVYSAGDALTVLGSDTLVAGWPTADDPASNAWTSDHTAVVTTFRLGAAPATVTPPALTLSRRSAAYQAGAAAPSAAALVHDVGASTDAGAQLSVDVSGVDFATVGFYTARIVATDPATGAVSDPALVAVRIVPAIAVSLGSSSASFTLDAGGSIGAADVLAALKPMTNLPGTISVDLSKVDQTASGTYPVTVTATDAFGLTGSASASVTIAVPTSVNVAVDGNGTASADPARALPGAPVSLHVQPKAGYRFTGWTSAADGGPVPAAAPDGSYAFVMPDAGTVTLTAHFAGDRYTVAYDGNGATGGSTNATTHVYGTASPLAQNGFDRTGYAFTGWATVPGGPVVYAAGQSVADLSQTDGAAVTLYAMWRPVVYAIAYDLGGGMTSAAYADSYTVTSAAITLTPPIRYAYTFAGWQGTGITGTAMSVTIPAGSTGDRSYTATWVPAAPTWSATTVYVAGDKVVYEGKLYVASWWTKNDRPGAVDGPWQEIGQPVITARGVYTTWTPSAIYTGGQTVAFGGHLFTAAWWTRNDVPGAVTKLAGPWIDLGAY
jgi:uncharacterized repeat protein (TIGR02543 family)